MESAAPPEAQRIPATLIQPGAPRFWLAVTLTGIGAGVAAIILTLLLEMVQRAVWGGDGRNLLEVAARAGLSVHVLALLGAGVVTGIGQLLLVKLTSGNGIDTTTALWFTAGRMPLLRTLGSATLSVMVVGMGASLGREGAPKQAGAVAANYLSDRMQLSDDQRRLLVACGAGAGMAAAYGVPLGGALFALEVLRGALALRLILPALLTSLVATSLSWLVLPDAPTYHLPVWSGNGTVMLGALIIGPLAGLLSVYYVRGVGWADRNKPTGWKRLVAPALVLGVLGLLSVPFPQLLGNGKDTAQLLFVGGAMSLGLVLVLLLLKPISTLSCMGSGTPGGLFTPSLTAGALLGAAVGGVASHLGVHLPAGCAAFLGAGAVLAASTQGPISTVVLLMEMTGHARVFIAPLTLAVISSTLVSRTLEPRSIYEARLNDREVQARMAARDSTTGRHRAR
ncbi:MAG: chloride channel protein [Candidatus Xenobia bacterium]